MSEAQNVPAHTSAAEEEDYYLVDEDGNVIESAAEGSCLMAEGLLEMKREQTGEDFIVVEPYAPDFDVAAAQAKSLAFFESAARREAEVSETPIENAMSAADEGEEFEEEEFPTMGSRDMTDPEDWRLEAIQKRQLNKEKEGGLWAYLCKWAGHEEPTWETREVMEDAGWIPQLDAFDKGKANNRFESCLKVSEPSRLESYFGKTDAEILGKVNVALAKNGDEGTNTKVKRYCRINTAREEPFLQRWDSLKETHVPQLVYHGTRARNFSSIHRRGLLAGGSKGVKVDNGALYGNGVYTSTSGWTPIDFSQGCNAVIVCVGLVPITFETSSRTKSVNTNCGDYIIFQDVEDVYPMWLVQFGGELHKNGYSTPIGFNPFVELSQRSFREAQSNDTDWCKQIARERRLAELALREDKFALTESENRKVDRAMRDLAGTRGGIKMRSLKGQPRKVKELLALAAVERRR